MLKDKVLEQMTIVSGATVLERYYSEDKDHSYQFNVVKGSLSLSLEGNSLRVEDKENMAILDITKIDNLHIYPTSETTYRLYYYGKDARVATLFTI